MVGVSVFLIYLILGLFAAFVLSMIVTVATSGFRTPTCARCGVERRLGARYCARCGKSVWS